MCLFAQLYAGGNGVPQVRCPNCGTTINLENRRETDFSLILNALHSQARSFSELLRITRLPRKTLNIRLKELCTRDAIVKNKLYYLNGANPSKEWERKIMHRNSKLFIHKRAIILALLLCIGIPATTNFVLAIFAPSSTPEPQPIGYLTAIVTVNNVSDVYGWQVGIRFNSTNLSVASVTPGSFLKNENLFDDMLGDDAYLIHGTWFAKNTIHTPEYDVLVIGQTLLGKDTARASGSGDLVVVSFAIWHAYELPKLVFKESPQYNTMLLKIDTTEIPLKENTIVLHYSP